MRSPPVGRLKVTTLPPGEKWQRSGVLPTNPVAGSRCTAATLDTRTTEVVRLLAEGGTRRDVLALCADEWGFSSRSADRLLAAARQQIRSDWDIERPQMIAELLSRLSEIQQESRRTGRLGVALAAINASARLAGTGTICPGGIGANSGWLQVSRIRWRSSALRR